MFSGKNKTFIKYKENSKNKINNKRDKINKCKFPKKKLSTYVSRGVNIVQQELSQPKEWTTAQHQLKITITTCERVECNKPNVVAKVFNRSYFCCCRFISLFPVFLRRKLQHAIVSMAHIYTYICVYMNIFALTLKYTHKHLRVVSVRKIML